MLVLLDRDGVLNAERGDFVKTPDELVMLPGAAAAVARLSDAGHRIVVVTNQSVVGRGVIDEAMLARIHDKLRREIAAAGGRLDEIIYCPDAPWAASERRKPAPGMLREAMARHNGRPDAACMIGDSLRDLEAAARIGCRRILVRSGHGAETQAAGLPTHVLPVSVYRDLGEAAAALLGGGP